MSTDADFFLSLLSLLSGQIVPAVVGAIFVSYFGLILPPIVWYRMTRSDRDRNETGRSKTHVWAYVGDVAFGAILAFGFASLGCGLHASVRHILHEYECGNISRPFAKAGP